MKNQTLKCFFYKNIIFPIYKVNRKMSCEKQTSIKYTTRSSPPISANDCPGKTRKGNDGLMYVSTKVYKWVKVSTKPKSSKPKTKSSKPKTTRKTTKRTVKPKKTPKKKEPKPCNDDQYRSPTTNRCKKIKIYKKVKGKKVAFCNKTKNKTDGKVTDLSSCSGKELERLRKQAIQAEKEVEKRKKSSKKRREREERDKIPLPPLPELPRIDSFN